MIEFKDISLSFQEKVIFDQFNAKISAGQRVCISGASGRGKSSLLKLLQGYLIPDSGSILINDDLISHKSIVGLREKMSWVPQNINLPVNNGKELIELMELPDILRLTEENMEKLDMGVEFLEQDFNEISGGQKQRIIISIVMSLNKPILLMDEPTSSLDERSIKLLVKLIESLKGTTVLSASHNKTWLDHSEKVIQL